MEAAISRFYEDKKESAIYGNRLVIYRRGDTENGVYSFRASIPDLKGYIRRSCKTSNAARAMVFAEDAYQDLLVRQKGGFSLKTLTVDKFYRDWLERKKHNLTPVRAAWKQNVFERYMSAYFGTMNVADLTKKFCDGYWDFRLSFWQSATGRQRIEVNESRINAKTKSSRNVAKVPSFATLKAEASLINEFLRVAVDEGHLARTIKVSPQDAMPKDERGDGYRDTFTDHEWQVLTSNLYNYALCRGRFADKRVNVRHRLQRQMLRAMVLLASSTGVRVGELKQLKWSDLEYRYNDTSEKVLVLSIRSETSKVRRGRTAVAHSEHIMGVLEQFKNVSERTDLDDLIFYSEQKDGSIGPADMSVSFKNFLRRCDYEGRAEGLRFSKDGKARTLYSLRHFYAIQRLKQNVDVFQLATNMGTGVEQIRNHYGRHISGDAFIRELTKFKSKTGEKTKEASLRKLLDMVQSGILDEEMALDAFKKVSELG